MYERNKVQDCQEDPAKVWKVSKQFMGWHTGGSPNPLEIVQNGKKTLCGKAKLLAGIMNEFFV